MHKAISASAANQRFSELLRRVSEGESFTVISRGRPVALVTPVDQAEERRKVADFLSAIAELPVRLSGPWTRDDLYE